METIADFLMEILPTNIGDWLSEHFFVRLMRKVKSKALRFWIALTVTVVGFLLVLSVVLLAIIGIMLLLN